MSLLIFLLLFTILCVVLDDGRAWDNATRSVRNDLVFEGRHQGYGAYEIRRDYDRRFLIALFSGIGIMGALIGLAYLLGGLSGHVITAPPVGIDPGREVIMTITPPAGGETAPTPSAPAPSPRPSSASTPSGFVEAGVVDTTTKVDPDPRPIGDPVGGDPGPVGPPGPAGGLPGDGGTLGGGTSGGGGGFMTDTLETWGVDHAPLFPGGETAMFRWVQNNVRFPDRDRAGKRTIHVRFVVDRAGRVSDVRAVRGGPEEFAREAERLVRNMPAWTPARYKDKDVPCRLVLPISFEVR